ncbi:MAG: hypothetical protein Q7R70_05580 [Candidatus Diapherotrites archaeon]|nr:hypothetical protein [Candidatus Diapherotrites archaeon]
MRIKLLKIKSDFSDGEQGFNFFIGPGQYEKRISELIVPETIFEQIYEKAQKLKLNNLAKLQYHGGVGFEYDQIKPIILELTILEKQFIDKKTLKYLNHIKELCVEALNKKLHFHVIGL